MSLAANTYTFLLTDIEGSTALLQEAQSAMLAALERHDEILGTLLEAHGGHVFKTMGDAFYAAFPSPLGALRAAVAIQQALGRETWDLPRPLRVRIALHVGISQVRAGDYFGPAVNHAHRLLGTAYGGQVLLSESAQVCVREAMPDGVALRGLGPVRLRSFDLAEPVFQVAASGLTLDFPPLRSLKDPPHNLKEQLTSFVGRDRELGEILTLCRQNRLATITGMGGCGKTRLARQAAQELLADFPDGVWLVELANLSDPERVGDAVKDALRVRQEGGQSVEDALQAHLRARCLLVVLDNCEHVIDVAARLAQTLLETCSQLTILATSRERLGVSGERVWPIPPLELPRAAGATTVEALLASEAARLFMERAKAAKPGFSLSAGNAPIVAQVCRRLEGIPLALELAAANLRMMPVEQLASRLGVQFRFQAAGPRGAADRHKTLQATIDWSYDLLTESERMLLCRLSVFAGGWTLESAESVCSGDGIEADEILDLLARLVDKSLVTPEEHEGAARFRLLETLRVYSLDKLRDQSGLETLRTRHAAHFLEWAETAEPFLSGPMQPDWLNNIERDHDNLRAALGWLNETDAEAFQRLACALYSFWYTHGHLTEGRAWLEQAIQANPAAETIHQAKVINRAGILAWVQGDLDAAEACYHQSLSICRILGDEARVAAVLTNLAIIASNRNDFDMAMRLQGEALEIYERLDDPHNVAFSLHNLGATAAECGDEATALARYRQSRMLFQSLGDDYGVALALRCLGAGLYRCGEIAESQQSLCDALNRCHRLGDREGCAFVLEYLGFLGISAGNFIRGVTLIAGARRLKHGLGITPRPYEHRIAERHLLIAREALSPESLSKIWDSGENPPLDSLVAYGLQ